MPPRRQVERRLAVALRVCWLNCRTDSTRVAKIVVNTTLSVPMLVNPGRDQRLRRPDVGPV